MPGTPVPEERQSRRDVFKALGVAAGGAIAGTMLLAKKAKADHAVLNASTSGPNPAIHGHSTSSGNGLLGTSTTGDAIRGDTEGTDAGDAGVLGRAVPFTGAATGVSGVSFGDNGVGVRARGATALYVDGPAKFTTAGAGTIPMDQISAAASNASVTALSHITVTLTGDPGQAGSIPGFKPVVVWVERQPGTGFVVHMSRPVRANTPFTYLIVEPVSA